MNLRTGKTLQILLSYCLVQALKNCFRDAVKFYRFVCSPYGFDKAFFTGEYLRLDALKFFLIETSAYPIPAVQLVYLISDRSRMRNQLGTYRSVLHEEIGHVLHMLYSKS